MDIDTLQSMLAELFPGLLGMRLLEVRPEQVVGELLARPDLCTTGGIMHGGAIMAFADTLGAIGTFINLEPGAGTATSDSSTKFIAGVKGGGTVRGQSLAVHRGRRTMVWQTRISNAEGRLCALVTQTQLVLKAS